MQYNFDAVIDRSNTSSSKWHPAVLRDLFGSEDVLPVWLADMDFLCPPAVVEAMKKRADHGVYGYTARVDGYYEAVINWMKRRHNFDVKQEWIVFTPGVVTAVNIALNAYCKPGDKIIIQPPVYHPFANSIRENDMVILNNNMIYENGTYQIDFDNFELLAKDPETKMFILCNPHNPGGRVFTKEELQRLGDICLENNVIVLADEIHNDLVFEKGAHTVFTNVDKKFEDITVICTAPSKTFNIAGLNTSHIIIPNKELRDGFNKIVEKIHISGQTPFSIEAVKACYNESEEWLEALLVYLKGNVEFVDTYLKENIPNIKLVKREGTYLGWLDFTYYAEKGIDICELVHKNAKVGFQAGSTFGENGKDFMRFCYACPRSILEEAFARIKTAVEKLEV